MPKNALAQSYGAVKLACFPGWPVIGKSTINVTKNPDKTMPKNVPAQSYEVFKLVSFPAWPVTKISKSANMKNLDTIGKSIRDQKRKETNT